MPRRANSICRGLAGRSQCSTTQSYNPNRPEDGTRTITFSRELYVEAEDFLEEPVPKYKRLYPGGPECRLKGAYLITCTGCKKDEAGNVVEILATYDPDSRGGNPADGRKVKGATIHWVDAATAVDAECRLYDNLFTDPGDGAGAVLGAVGVVLHLEGLALPLGVVGDGQLHRADHRHDPLGRRCHSRGC